MTTAEPSDSHHPPISRSRVLLVTILALLLGIAAIYVALHRKPDPSAIPQFSIPVGAVRQPLPDRIVSFHRGRADKHLILLASQLGFNGVQFQIEGSNEGGIKDFAARDQKEHLIDYCHSLGMKVTAWVHELADLPYPSSPDYLGPVSVDNEKLWKRIEERYEWILGTAIPNVDGLVLTTVETQVKATDTPLLLKLVTLLDAKCRQHGKELTVRTFVWHPKDLDSVMAAFSQIPDHIKIMSKVVPQDWQMRGANAREIGAVGKHAQVVEYDVAGEYFLTDHVANCMVDILKRQFDYGLTKGVKGICVRVDRYDASVLWEPNEVNLWTLGLLAAGATDSAEDIWNRWATYRFGDKAAPAVITALKPTSEVIAEMLSIGPFTYGDTRGPNVNGVPSYRVAQPDDEIFYKNWQMWRWDDSYLPVLAKADTGDPVFLQEEREKKAAALETAKQCLANLEKAQPLLSSKDYQILRTRLLTNQYQLEFRSAATLAALHIRQVGQASLSGTLPQFNNAAEAYKQDIDSARDVAKALRQFPAPVTFNYLGKRWQVNAPLLLSADELDKWTDSALRTPALQSAQRA